jgi:ribosomal protein S27AE
MSVRYIYMLMNIQHKMQGTTIQAVSRYFYTLPQETQRKLLEGGQLHRVTEKGAWITAKILTPEELALKKEGKRICPECAGEGGKVKHGDHLHCSRCGGTGNLSTRRPDIAYFDAQAAADTIEWYGVASAIRVKPGDPVSPRDADRILKAQEALKESVVAHLQKAAPKILQQFTE